MFDCPEFFELSSDLNLLLDPVEVLVAVENTCGFMCVQGMIALF